MRLDGHDMHGCDSAEPGTTDCYDDDDEEEEEEEPSVEEELLQRKVDTSYTADAPTLFVVDYEPTDIMFPDRVRNTVAAFKAVAGVPLVTVHLEYAEYEASWKHALGELRMFPAYLVATGGGVYKIGSGSFLHQMYILQAACSA